jgi:hypothetical protein
VQDLTQRVTNRTGSGSRRPLRVRRRRLKHLVEAAEDGTDANRRDHLAMVRGGPILRPVQAVFAR